jgi:hypothetical protein
MRFITIIITSFYIGESLHLTAAIAAAGCHVSAGQPSFVCDGVACNCPPKDPSNIY